MQTSIKPYIGIAGFMNRYEVDSVAKFILPHDIPLMVGVLVSRRSLRNEPTRHPRRYPCPADIASICGGRAGVTNLVHYYTGRPNELLGDLLKLDEIAGEHCHGFQLNVAWPPPKILEKYRRKYPGKILVLQCGAKALGEAGDHPPDVAKKVKEYDGLIDHVLIDQSGGQGKPFHHYFAAWCFSEIRGQMKVGLGVAGGLNAENLDSSLRPLIARFGSTFSVDVESGVRDRYGDLDIAEAAQYYKKACQMFSQAIA